MTLFCLRRLRFFSLSRSAEYVSPHMHFLYLSLLRLRTREHILGFGQKIGLFFARRQGHTSQWVLDTNMHRKDDSKALDVN